VWGVKRILLMLAAVALVGCGKKDSPEPQTKAKGTPKAADKKPLTEEESAKVIEAAIRSYPFDKPMAGSLKPTGELTKADYEKVIVLQLENNQLTSVKGLEKLTQLWGVGLKNNQLTDVKGLEKLTKLEELGLENNQLTDVKGLEKLTQLDGLFLDGNQLTNVKGLEKLTQLKRLFLKDNPDLTKAQIDQLKKALPKCGIVSDHD
jgi:hypothetical protein